MSPNSISGSQMEAGRELVADLRNALYLVKRLGVFGARQYAAEYLRLVRPGVCAALGSLDSRQTRARNIRFLQSCISPRGPKRSAVRATGEKP